MNQEIETRLDSQKPTRVRYGVLGFACSLSMITYLDRTCFASAATPIRDALGLLDVSDLTWAFTAFTFSYAAMEIPSGWLGDVFGPRNVLIRIVLWWSLFTALTGMTGETVWGVPIGIGALVVIRFMFGMGEAGTYPNITRALHNWFPYTERGMAQGTVWMSGRLMGGLTPLVWLLLVEKWHMPWRWTFWLFGGLGVVWCGAFSLFFRNRPDEHAAVNAAELELIRAGRLDIEAAHAHVPWGKLFTNTNLWAVCLMYFCGAYGWYFNITYLPQFLETHFEVTPDDTLGAVYKGGPLWMGAIACLGGGFLTDWFIRRTGNRKWGRRLFGIIGHSLCALCYLACLYTSSAFSFFLAISLAAFFNDLTMGAAWSVCQDIGNRYSAIVAGCMNTVGNLGGAAANLLTGLILKYTLDGYASSHNLDRGHLTKSQLDEGLFPGYQINFVVFGLVYVIAVLLWLRIDATETVIQDQE